MSIGLPAPSDRSGRERLLLIAGAGVAVVAGIASILWVNDGTFTFTLDDPYIHLRLAREIARGHYGYNAGEAASPASSIAYPFLLAPFAAAGIGPLAALLWNVVPLLLLTAQLHRWLDAALGLGPRRASIVTVFILCGFNIAGLAFAGMETVLQVWLCVLVCRGLWQIVSAGSDPDRAFWFAVVVGPLIRYEMLAMTLAATVVYAGRRHRILRPLTALGVAVAPVLAFSLFLVTHGLSLLPDSVLVKAQYLDPGRHGGEWLSLVQNLIGNVSTAPGALVAALALAVQIGAARRRQLRPYGLTAAFLLIAQLGVGEVGWWGRYEAWVLVTMACLALAAWAPFQEWPAAVSPGAAAAVLLGAVVLTTPYLKGLVQTPIGARNVYAQHMQMAHIVKRLGVKAVALNDIGAVGWENPDVYVFDLAGLASHEMLTQLRCCGLTRAWYERAGEAHRIELVLTYEAGLGSQRPATWNKVAELVLEGKALRVGGRAVAIYATGVMDQARVRAGLNQVASQLPATARIVFP